MYVKRKRLSTFRDSLRDCEDPWVLQLVAFNVRNDLRTRLVALNNPVCPQWVHPIHATLHAHFVGYSQRQLRFAPQLQADLLHRNPRSDDLLTLRYHMWGSPKYSSDPMPPNVPKTFHADFRIHVYENDRHVLHNLFGPAHIAPHVAEWYVDGKYQNVSGPSQIRSYKDRVDYHFKGRDAADVSAAAKACDSATAPTELAKLVQHDDPVVAAIAAHNPACPTEARVQWGLSSTDEW